MESAIRLNIKRVEVNSFLHGSLLFVSTIVRVIVKRPVVFVALMEG